MRFNPGLVSRARSCFDPFSGSEAPRRIADLYVIEARVRGQPSAHGLAERRSFSKPIVQTLHSRLEAQLPLVSGRSTLAEAIRNALSRWEGLHRWRIR